MNVKSVVENKEKYEAELIVEVGKEEFEAAVYALGLKLIEDFKAGNCRDSDKTLQSIIELFKVSAPKN